MSRELYVGSLSYKATAEDLRRLFSVAGTVIATHLITDPESGKSKGCGYVKMASEAEAKEALVTLDGALLIDRQITVSVARPHPQTPPPKGHQRRRPGGRPAGGKPSSGKPAPGKPRR